MSKKIEVESRRQIARFLPDAIAQALTSYHKFAVQPVPEDAKKFGDHHRACKVAVAHIELLLKLARWADLPDAKAEDHNNQILLAAMMQEAEDQLRAYHAQNGDDDPEEDDEDGENDGDEDEDEDE